MPLALLPDDRAHVRQAGVMETLGLTAGHVLGIVDGLSGSGVKCWLMGGWGVDALLGKQTRAHHDLDLIVDVSDLPALDGWLRQEDFFRALAWPENAPVSIDGRTWDTAFVEQHSDGRELDVHAVHIENGVVRLATKDPWQLPPCPLDGRGHVGARVIHCVTAEAQRAMHRGYDLPPIHRDDLRNLKRS